MTARFWAPTFWLQCTAFAAQPVAVNCAIVAVARLIAVLRSRVKCY